jgi:Family of unknown function (DUF6084)
VARAAWKLQPVPGQARRTSGRLRGVPAPAITVVGAAPVARSPVPMLAFALCATEPEGRSVYAIALSIRLYIDPIRRSHCEDTKERIARRLGPNRIWAMEHRLLWRTLEVIVPGFDGEAIFELPLVCSCGCADPLSVYLSCLDDGDAPLSFHIRGLVFCFAGHERLGAVPLRAGPPVRFDLAVETWRRAFDGCVAEAGGVAPFKLDRARHSGNPSPNR